MSQKSMNPSLPTVMMQHDEMREATLRAERVMARHGIAPEHSRDLAVELGLSFALASLSAITQINGGAS